MLTLEDVYVAIAAAEEVVDPTLFVLDGVNVWLPTRDLFIRPYFERREHVYRQALGTFSHSDPFDWAHAPRDRLAAVPGERPTAVDLGDLVLCNVHDQPYDDSVRCDVLIHHAFTDYGEIVDGGVFNRVNDGLVDVLPDDVRVAKVLTANASSMLVPYHHPTHFILERLPDRLHDPVDGERAYLELVARVAEDAAAGGRAVVHRPAWLLGRMRELFWRAAAYDRLLDVLRPRVVCFQSYSRMEREAMVLASWRRGIPTVDVEHGFMGPFSPYGQLGFVSGHAPNRLLPRWFWSWGQENRQFLESSLGSATRWHTPVVGGSTWHRTTAHGAPARDGSSDLPSMFQERLRDARRVVLFCWQPDMLVHGAVPELLPAHLLHAVRDQPEPPLLLVRLHPRSHHLIPDAERALAEAGVADHEIVMSTTSPLPALLPYADVLATSYSTVAFEANALGIEVLVTDDFGTRMLARQVERGVFLDGSDRTRAALALSRPRREIPRVDYLDETPGLPGEALATILAGDMPPV